jgi:hypothetical protein
MSWHNPLCFWKAQSTIRLVRGAERASSRVAPDVPLRRDRACAAPSTGVTVEARSPEAERKRGGVEAKPKNRLQARGPVRGARSGRQGGGGEGADARTNAQKRPGSASARSPLRHLIVATAFVLSPVMGFIREETMQVRLILNCAGWVVSVGAQRASSRVAPDVPLRRDRACAAPSTGVTV